MCTTCIYIVDGDVDATQTPNTSPTSQRIICSLFFILSVGFPHPHVAKLSYKSTPHALPNGTYHSPDVLFFLFSLERAA